MKKLQNIGLSLFLIGLAIFTSLIFFGKYEVTPEILDNLVSNKGIKSELFINNITSIVVGEKFSNPFAFSSEIITALETANETHKQNSEWDKMIWDKPHSFSYELAKQAGSGLVKENKWLFWWLTFGLGIIGALMYIIPNVVMKGPPGIKNNGVWFNAATNRGWIGWFVFVFEGVHALL